MARLTENAGKCSSGNVDINSSVPQRYFSIWSNFPIMWVTVLVLALMAMADPVRNGTAILLLSRQRPMRNLLAFWIGGLATAILVGLCVLFVLRDVTLTVMQPVALTVANASAGHIRIVIGVLALLIAALIASKFSTHRRASQQRTPSAFVQLSTRAQNTLEGGCLWVPLVAGLGSAIPWEYLVALAAILASGASAGAQVSALVVFTLVTFAVAEIPFVSHLAAPATTDVVVMRLHNWSRVHRRQILALIVAAAGVLLLATEMGSG